MGIGDTLSKEVRAWGTLGILVVIMSLILLKFKTSNIGSITCASGYTYNSTANNCYNATATTNITALSEPKNWVIIAIIALIGFSILKYFQKKSR